MLNLNRVRFQNVFLMWMFFAMVFALQACALREPFQAAETAEQKVYAAYGSYAIVLDQVAEFTNPENDAVPQEARIEVAEASLRVEDVAAKVREGYKDYVRERDAFKEGATTQSALEIALANLNRWATDLQVAVAGLVASLAGGSQ